jgi:hypothetical protein
VLQSHLPLLNVQGSVLSLYNSPKIETLRLLHVCLGHAHPETNRCMIHENMVVGMPSDLNLEDTPLNCPHCVMTKSTHEPYPKMGQHFVPDERKELKVADEVVSDSMGPISPISREGNCYVVEF